MFSSSHSIPLVPFDKLQQKHTMTHCQSLPQEGLSSIDPLLFSLAFADAHESGDQDHSR